MKHLFLLLALFCAPAFSQVDVYKQFTPGGDLAGSGSTWNSQIIAPGAVTLAKQANLAADSIPCNATTSPATQTACNPLAVANLMSAVISVIAADFVDTSIPSGLPKTVDGVAIQAGQSVYLGVITGNVGNGIYIAQSSGSWTRATNFPNGYVIPQNCNLAILTLQGTLFGDTVQHIITTSGPITIGTTAITVFTISAPQATPTVAGTTTVTDSISYKAVDLIAPPSAQYDCATFDGGISPTSGGISDDGNAAFTTGPCVVSDPNGHPILNGNGTGPNVTGTGCSLAAGTNTDNAGAIVAAGVDTCTLAFGSAFTTAPHCSVGNIGATVIANLTALPTTAHAIFLSTAAGTFNYICL